MRLEIIKGDGEAEVFETYERSIIVGRGNHVGCRIEEDGVSREHLRLDLKGSDVYVMDMGSSNGSYIQDQRLEPNKTQIWPALFPIRMGRKVAITLLPDTEAIDSTLARVHNPFAKKRPPIKQRTASASAPRPSYVSPVARRSRFPKFLFAATVIIIVVVAIFLAISYFNPFLRAKILP